MKYEWEDNMFVLRRIYDLSDDPTPPELSYFTILYYAGICYVGDAVIRTDEELLEIPGFTEDYLNDLKQLLKAKELSLGTKMEWWPPLGWERPHDSVWSGEDSK